MGPFVEVLPPQKKNMNFYDYVGIPNRKKSSLEC
jgi:hypothetical protein